MIVKHTQNSTVYVNGRSVSTTVTDIIEAAHEEWFGNAVINGKKTRVTKNHTFSGWVPVNNR